MDDDTYLKLREEILALKAEGFSLDRIEHILTVCPCKFCTLDDDRTKFMRADVGSTLIVMANIGEIKLFGD